MKTAARWFKFALSPWLMLIPGCGILATSPLAGSWVVTVDNAPDLKTLVLTFDRNGGIESIQYQVGPNAVITVPSPVGRTNVDGDSVVISATFNNNTLSFSGTFNETETLISGNLTTLISFGGTVVTIDNGPATLTKQ